MTSTRFLALAAIGLALPAAASAASYSVVGSYAALPASASPFIYGYSVGETFVAYDRATSACAGVSGLSCNYSSNFNNNTLPAVGLNTTGALLTNGSVRIPTDVVFMHPVGENSGLPAGDTIVRFVAPTAGTYAINGKFEILDVSATGTFVSIVGGSSNFAQSLSGAVFTPASFGFRTSLTAGQSLDFVVNSAGSYYNDSTGLSATIAAVPEPATWGLMIAGFGLVGVARRARRTTVAA